MIKKQKELSKFLWKSELEKLFKNARKIKPKYNLAAKQMGELIENEILR